MTPFERENARKRFHQFKSLPPEKKEELRQYWREYREASPEKRQQLRAQHPEIFGTEDFER
jgi:hypothetical protein